MKFLTLFCVAMLASAQPAAQPGNQPAALARLEGNIQRVVRSLNATWGIYIKCLQTGEEIAIDADRQMDTMSVIKLPLMAEVFRQVEEGKFALTDRVTVTAESKRPGTGIIRSLDAGVQLTIQDLLTLMVIVSDNTATDLLYDKIGGIAPVNRLMESWGLRSTRALGTASDFFKAMQEWQSKGGPEAFYRAGKNPFGLSTPREIGRLLERMEKGEAVSPHASRQMLQIMGAQLYSTRLPRYVTGYHIPHKTGDFLPYIANDVGVLKSRERSVVMSVFTANHFGSRAAIEDAIGRIAELTGNYFAK